MYTTAFFRLKNVHVLITVCAMILFAGCKKEDPVDNNNNNNNNNGQLSNNPTAKAEHDHDAGGIYKGVVTGSAGYVYIHFKNSSNLVYAILHFDGNHDS